MTEFEIKICKKCGESKPLEVFPPNKLGRDGHEGSCKTCKNEYQRELKKKRNNFWKN